MRILVLDTNSAQFLQTYSSRSSLRLNALWEYAVKPKLWGKPRNPKYQKMLEILGPVPVAILGPARALENPQNKKHKYIIFGISGFSVSLLHPYTPIRKFHF